MNNQVISEEQYNQLNMILENVVVQAETDAVFLCDFGGNILNKVVAKSETDADQTIAALASGSFAATNELASLIGEPTFRSIYHKGDKASIYIQNVGARYLMLVIFSEATTIGLVKLYVDKANEELVSILDGMTNQKTAQDVGENSEFKIDEDSKVF